MDLSTGRLPKAKDRLRWNWNKANWVAFREEVDAKVALFQLHHPEECSLGDRVRFFEGALLGAAKAHIGMVRLNRPDRKWLTPEVKEAIRIRNRLARDISNRRAEWLNACRNVRDLIVSAKQRAWREYVDSLMEKPDSSRSWNTIRSLSGKCPTPAERSKVLFHEGKGYRTDRGKADLFVQEYAKVSRLSFSKQERKKNSDLKRRLSLARRSVGLGEEECADFSLAELDVALRMTKAKGAGGADGIEPRFLKELGETARVFILGCFNQSWREGFCPQSWRTAIIVPLLKSGKSADTVDSYRPISLTSCLGKVLERMVVNRLIHLAESRGLLCEDQAGFRGQRSTEDQILRITQTISDGFQARPALRSLLALLDFSKAYDTVWRADLLGGLLDHGIPYPYVAWINGFLANRLARVRLNRATSRTLQFQEGLPQGSVLSPLLFLFFINSLVSRLPPESVKSLFADDVALLRQHSNKELAAEALEEDVNVVWRWSQEKKLRLNISKCEVSFFSSDSHESKWQPSIRVEGSTLPFNPTPVFLGVIYDRMLTFKPQVEKVCRSMTKGARLLGALSGREWGWNGGLLRRVYRAIPLSIANYCGAGWQPWLAKSTVAMLDRAQNRCLRAITGLLSTAPVESLRLEAGIPGFSTSIRRNAAIALEKSLRLCASNPRQSLAMAGVRQRTVGRSNWRKLASESVEEIGLSAHPRLPLPPVTSAPWQWGNKDWSVSLSLLRNSQRSDPPEAKLSDTLDTIRSLGQFDFIIFTDGSAEGGVQCGGGAAVICEGSIDDLVVIDTLRARGAAVCSSFDSEVCALGLAVGWLLDKGLANQRCLICSDSQAALAALDNRLTGSSSDMGAVRQRLRLVRCSVFFQWVPGHCGLLGNELADQAAREAATDRSGRYPPLPVSFASAKAFVRRAIRDSPLERPLVKEVYSRGRITPLSSRKAEVIVARLRSGHSTILAEYRARFGLGGSSTCPHCGDGDESLEHWFRQCSASMALRMRCFGTVSPPLSALSEGSAAVASYLRGLRLL